jgi:hypothetical protein
MSALEVKWLSSVWQCETCGLSYADGALVLKDGETLLELTPHAHCFEGVTYDREDVYRRILAELGHSVTEAES